MGKVVLTTLGTAGDLVPYVRIGSGLQARGYDATVLTHCAYEGWVKDAGLDFVSLDTPEAFERFAEDIPLLDTPQGLPVFFQRHVLPKITPRYRMIIDRCRDREAILVARAAPGMAARMAAEALGIPLVTVFHAPSHVETLPVIQKLVASVFGSGINQSRAEVGLPPVGDWSSWWHSAACGIGLWPEWFAAPEAGGQAVTLVGFPWHGEAVTAAADDVPQEFARMGAAGAPVLITHGSSSAGGSDFFTVCAEACRQLGFPCALVTRFGELLPDPLPRGSVRFDYLPFASVVPHVAAVVHHGGPGTMDHALAAGVPQLVLPDSGERRHTGFCLQRLGVGEVLLPHQWEPDVIAQALRRLLGSPVVRERCAEVAHRVGGDDAISAACDLVEGIARGGLAGGPCPASRLASRPAGRREDTCVDREERLLALERLSPERRAFLARRLRKEKGAESGGE